MPGDYVKKPMQDCTGAEVLAEVLYHCGLENEINDILERADVLDLDDCVHHQPVRAARGE